MMNDNIHKNVAIEKKTSRVDIEIVPMLLYRLVQNQRESSISNNKYNYSHHQLYVFVVSNYKKDDSCQVKYLLKRN